MRPELLIIDCDGVLIDSEVISARTLIAALDGCGVAADLDFVARHFLGRAQPVVRAKIRDHWGVELPDSFEQEYLARLMAAFQQGLRPMTGAADAVAALRLPYCLATSSSPARLARSLAITGLDRFFAGRSFTAGDVARGKPAPDLFLHAAARMDADPAACVVIEDSLPGLEAGQAAGMQVWHFTGGSHLRGISLAIPPQMRPHRSFASFGELRAALPDPFHAPADLAIPK